MRCWAGALAHRGLQRGGAAASANEEVGVEQTAEGLDGRLVLLELWILIKGGGMHKEGRGEAALGPAGGLGAHTQGVATPADRERAKASSEAYHAALESDRVGEVGVALAGLGR